MIQDLNKFSVPAGFRGRSRWCVQLWWITESTLFRHSPQFAYAFRAALLRLFGAKIGIKVIVRPTVVITYPWKVSVGDYSWIGDDAVLYSLGNIAIGHNSVISQGSYLCAADHDYKEGAFTIRARPITIGNECWLAAQTFVAPGVSIHHGAVIGARSTVLSDMPGNMVCFGTPCRPVKAR